MGFLDKMFKGLGFEGEQKIQKEKKVKEQPKTEKTTFTSGAKYDLASMQEEKQPKVFEPQNQVEVQTIVDALKTEDAIIADLSKLSQSDYIRALDFVSGAIYYSGGKIQRAGDKKFYLYSGQEK